MVVHIKAYQLREGANSSANAKRILHGDYFRQAATWKFRNFRLINSARNCASASAAIPKNRRKKRKEKKIIEGSLPKVTIKRKVLPINGTDGDSFPVEGGELFSKENHKRSSPPRSRNSVGRATAYRAAKNSETNNYSHFPDDSTAFIKSNLSAAARGRRNHVKVREQARERTRKRDRAREKRERERGRNVGGKPPPPS